jgi:hypothetical protein
VSIAETVFRGKARVNYRNSFRIINHRSEL